MDAIAFDQSNGHIYADEDDGTQMFVIDAVTMKQIATVPLPGHKPEYLSVDPVTHVVYQNIADKSEVALIDPVKLAVSGTIQTPELTGNHPLQYDAAFKELVVGGANGVLSVYDPSGTKKYQTTMPAHIDQCDLNQRTHMLVCAGGTGLSLFALSPDAAPKLVGTYSGEYHVHTVAFDGKDDDVWAVMVDEGGTDGGFIQRFAVRP